MFTDDCPTQVSVPVGASHARSPPENRYGFLRLAPCHVLIVPMAFIVHRAAKLAVVAALQVWLVPSFGTRDPSRWPLTAPSFNSASRAQGGHETRSRKPTQRPTRPIARLSRFLLLRHPYVHDAHRDIAACSRTLIIAHQLEECRSSRIRRPNECLTMFHARVEVIP